MAAQNNKDLSSCRFSGSGNWERLSGAVLAQGLSQGCRSAISQGWRPGKVWETGRPAFKMAGALVWLWVGGLDSESQGLSHGLSGCLHNVAADSPRVRDAGEGTRRKPQAFDDPALKITHHHSHHNRFIRRESLSPAHTQGEGNRLHLLKARVSKKYVAVF